MPQKLNQFNCMTLLVAYNIGKILVFCNVVVDLWLASDMIFLVATGSNPRMFDLSVHRRGRLINLM